MRRAQLRGALLVSSILATFAQSSNSGQCDPNGIRVFCGWNGVPQDQCEGQYGCCYSPPPSTIGNGGAEVGLPTCFSYNTGNSSYSLQGGANGGTLTSQTGTMSNLGADISNLQLTVTNVSPSILRVTIGAPGRWTVPQGSLFTNVQIANGTGSNLYTYSSKASPFGFTVGRTGSNAAPVFDTTGHRLMFKDQYLEISTSIQAGSRFFGLGERVPSTGMELQKNGIPLALWTRDQPAADPDQNNYGAHPNVMEIRPDGSSSGVIMMNSNGMDVTLTNDTMRFSIIGGVLDMYFLLGPTPFAVTDQLTQVVGRPVMPPYWALGFMNSKYGYDSAEYYTYVIAQYAQAGIPLETFVADSQYMDHSQIWTLGSNFSQPYLASIIAGLHANGQRFVPIVEPVVHISSANPVYQSAQAADPHVFIHDVQGHNYVGQLWPGPVNFPDFKNPATVAWWQGEMTSFHKQVEYDGLWLDMNEPSNYCTGDVCQDPGSSVGEQNQFICQVSCQSGASLATNGSSNANGTAVPASYFSPPYSINIGNAQIPVSTKTVPVTANHYDGTLVYNTHNLYGLMMTQATSQGLIKLRNKRPFILTRSTFLGSGAYAAHWTGDTLSAWEDMQWSIPSVLNQGISGIPFAGADICGFQQYATESLCARWAAIGAWYPFCRDHHADGFQEFYVWPSVAQIARQQLGWRMRAMPYLYTAFFDAHQYGCPVMRPLFYSWPADEDVFAPSNTQFMIGDGLLINPVTVENSTSVSVYFPAAKWYSLYDYSVVDASAGSVTHSYEVGLTDNAPIYVLGGTVLPLGQGGMVTDAARNSSLTLIVAFPSLTVNAPSPIICGNGCPQPTQPGAVVACGHMYLDGGEDLELGGARDNYLTFFAQTTKTGTSGSLQVTFGGNPQSNGTNQGCSSGTVWPEVETVEILGLGTVDPSTVALSSVTTSNTTSAGSGLAVSLGQADVAFAKGALSITGFGQPLMCPEGFLLSWGAGSAVAANPTSTAG